MGMALSTPWLQKITASSLTFHGSTFSNQIYMQLCLANAPILIAKGFFLKQSNFYNQKLIAHPQLESNPRPPGVFTRHYKLWEWHFQLQQQTSNPIQPTTLIPSTLSGLLISARTQFIQCYLSASQKFPHFTSNSRTRPSHNTDYI